MLTAEGEGQGARAKMKLLKSICTGSVLYEVRQRAAAGFAFALKRCCTRLLSYIA